MTEPNISSIDNDTRLEDAEADDTAPEDTAPEDAAPEDAAPEFPDPEDTDTEDTASQNQSENQLLPLTSTRNWILYLPPEIRLIIYRHVLQLPYPIPYYLPMLRRQPFVYALTSIFFTSRLIQRESVNAFYRENTFYILENFRFTMFPTWPIADMIRNLSIDTRLWASHQRPHELFIGMIRTFGDPAIVRGTLTLDFLRRPTFRSDHLNFYLRALGRFTNFRVLQIRIQHRGNPVESVAPLYDEVENSLRPVLGPPSPRPAGAPLIFLPHRFLIAQQPPSDIDWMDHLDGLRLLENGDESNPDQNADESEPSASNSSSQG